MTARREDFLDHGIESIVDCRVEPEDRGEAMAFLAEHPEAARMVEAHRDLNARLRKHFHPVLEESIPRRLLRTAMRGARHRSSNAGRSFGIAAAVAALLVTGAIAGWRWWAEPGVPSAWLTFAEQAAYAHRLYAGDVSRPVELGADRSGELLAWLSRHLGMTVRAPLLESIGFRLIGGRLLPATDAAAGQLMYEHPDGSRISIYVRGDIPTHQEVEFQFAEEEGVLVLYWIEGPRGYALSGGRDRGRLLRIGKLVYDQLRS